MRLRTSAHSCEDPVEHAVVALPFPEQRVVRAVRDHEVLQLDPVPVGGEHEIGDRLPDEADPVVVAVLLRERRVRHARRGDGGEAAAVDLAIEAPRRREIGDGLERVGLAVDVEHVGRAEGLRIAAAELQPVVQAIQELQLPDRPARDVRSIAVVIHTPRERDIQLRMTGTASSSASALRSRSPFAEMAPMLYQPSPLGVQRSLVGIDLHGLFGDLGAQGELDRAVEDAEIAERPVHGQGQEAGRGLGAHDVLADQVVDLGRLDRTDDVVDQPVVVEVIVDEDVDCCMGSATTVDAPAGSSPGFPPPSG